MENGRGSSLWSPLSLPVPRCPELSVELSRALFAFSRMRKYIRLKKKRLYSSRHQQNLSRLVIGPKAGNWMLFHEAFLCVSRSPRETKREKAASYAAIRHSHPKGTARAPSIGAIKKHPDQRPR